MNEPKVRSPLVSLATPMYSRGHPVVAEI